MFQAPARQSVDATIATLSGRLATATLLEDRRAAITGLRSLAKDYPASVASEALRGLIGSLTKDNEDVDTIKITLETLLMLFSNESPESSEEIVLWIADEFTQHKDNFNLLLAFLDSNDFYPRLYSLQLISAILGWRKQRTEECIFMAPLGISRLVAVLDDKRDAIRNEGISLLVYLTPTSAELQKRVAFEDAFDRIFKIIESEGSLVNGDRIVEDCLTLLANLLRMNMSNQSFFREAKCVPKVARLLSDVVADHSSEPEVAEWAKFQANKNIYGLLAVLRLFLQTGAVGTQANQTAFAQNGILEQVLQLAFARSTEMRIKAEALSTCSDLIRGNKQLQEGFGQLQITSVLDEPLTEGSGALQQNRIPKVYLIDGLLDLALSVSLPAAFDSRLAACECLKAYFYHHARIREHFLERAIGGHSSGADETANVLTTLLQPSDSQVSGDPYRYWFAAVILFHIIFEDAKAKEQAMKVAEGDADSGEEVVTCIQTLAETLLIGIQKDFDERVLVAYLMLLCGWLFEDPDGVNDFLGEGSNLQGLVQAVLSNVAEGTLVQGLCCILLGIIYEFSTRDSPVPRATIYNILKVQVTRETYIDRLTRLRSYPLLRDFEVLPQRLTTDLPGLPDVLFDKTFVEFLKDNFSRLLRAIDTDPGLEIPVFANGMQKGISREENDFLRSQVAEKQKAFEDEAEKSLSLARQLGQEQADHRRDKETSAVEVARIKHINEGLQRNHEEEINKLQVAQKRVAQDHQRELETLGRNHEEEINNLQSAHKRVSQDHQRQLDALRAEQIRASQDHQRELEHVGKTADGNMERMRKRMEAENADLLKSLSKVEADLAKANKDHIQDLQTAHLEYTANMADQAARLQRAEEKARDCEMRSVAASKALEEKEKARKSALAQLEEKEEARKNVQSELDDLLLVFGDLEEKKDKYKERLKALGEQVSEGEEDEDEDGEGEDDEEDDGGVD